MATGHSNKLNRKKTFSRVARRYFMRAFTVLKKRDVWELRRKQNDSNRYHTRSGRRRSLRQMPGICVFVVTKSSKSHWRCAHFEHRATHMVSRNVGANISHRFVHPNWIEVFFCMWQLIRAFAWFPDGRVRVICVSRVRTNASLICKKKFLKAMAQL